MTFEYRIAGSRQILCSSSLLARSWRRSSRNNEKGFKRTKLRVLGIRLTIGEQKCYHVERPEDSERNLFGGRESSPSEDVTLEEEGVTVTGGRLPRFLNLLSKLRFLDKRLR